MKGTELELNQVYVQELNSFRISLGVIEFFGEGVCVFRGSTEVTLHHRKMNIDPPEVFM